MFRRILVAFDGSAASRLALDECLRLKPGAETDVHLVGILHPPPIYLLAGEFVAEPPADDGREGLEADLDAARAQLVASGMKVQAQLQSGDPIDIMTKLVQKLEIDLVILGHPRSTRFAQRWWRGDVDALLIERVRCSILIAADPLPKS
jgi:nucleotide-binding universal stress UspA family protein